MKKRSLQWMQFLLLALMPAVYSAQNNVMSGVCEVTFNIGDEVTRCASSSFYSLPAGSPAGGTYSGNGVLDNFFLANLAGPGQHIITYSYDNGVCSGSASDTITVVTPVPLLLSGDMELCFGESTTITVLNGEDIEWESGATGTSEFHDPLVTTDYSVYAFDENGCLTAAGYTIIVHELPSVEILGDTSLCLGENTTLNASGAEEYVWSNGSNENAIFVDVIENQMYSLIGTDEFGCVNEDVTTVTVHEYPVVTASEVVSGCPGSELILLAGGAATYEWSFGNTGDVVSVIATSSELVTVVGTNEHGCIDEANTQIIVHPIPVFEIQGDSEICVGEMAELTAVGNYSFLWDNGSENNSIAVSPETNSVYSVVAENGFGCVAENAFVVTVFELPEISISGESEICFGEQTTLTALGAMEYNWSSGGMNVDETLSPETTTSYQVTGTDMNGCSNQISFDVVVRPLPQVEISGDEEVCTGSFGQYSVIDGYSYLWSNGATGNLISRLITSDQIIGVAVEDEFGCQSMAEISVIAAPVPQISIDGDLEICHGESTFISVSGANTYLWSDDSSDEVIELNPNATQSYSVVGIGENGCEAEIEFEIDVFTTNETSLTYAPEDNLCVGDTVIFDDPEYVQSTWNTPTGVYTSDTLQWVVLSANDVITLQSVDENGCLTVAIEQELIALTGPEIILEGDTEICEGETIVLSATGSDNYLWENGSIENSIVVNPINTTSFSVSSSNGTCTTVRSIQVNVNSIPIIGWNGDTQVCSGESIVLELSGANSFEVNSEQIGSVYEFAPLESGEINVVGYNSSDCFSSSNISFAIDSLPVVQILEFPSPVCYGSEITLEASGAEEYVWSNESIGETISYAPFDGEQLQVVGTDGNGCSQSAIVFFDVTDQVNLQFEYPDTLCVFVTAPGLDASPSGGVFSGVGVVNGNEFNIAQFEPETLVELTYTYTDNNGCVFSDVETVFTEICFDVQELVGLNFSTYPNPAKDFMVISSQLPLDQIRIFNLQGQLLCAFSCNGVSAYTLNLSEISAAMYQMEVSTKNGLTHYQTIVVSNH